MGNVLLMSYNHSFPTALVLRPHRACLLSFPRRNEISGRRDVATRRGTSFSASEADQIYPDPFEILSGHETSCVRGREGWREGPTEMAEIAQIYRSIQQTVGALSDSNTNGVPMGRIRCYKTFESGMKERALLNFAIRPT